MGTINPTKAAEFNFIPHSHVQHPDTVLGTARDVSGIFALGIQIYHGHVENAVNTNNGYFIVRKSFKSSGDDDWVDVVRIDTQTADPDLVNFNASEAAGQTDLTVDVITGLAQGDLLYLQDTNGGAPTSTTGALSSPETLSEWRRLRKVSGTTVTVQDAITNAKDTSDDIYNDATVKSLTFDVSTWKRARVDFVHEGTIGTNCHIKVTGTELDELATA